MMRMNCPRCGLGGTVTAEYYLSVVKCPACRRMFRVTGAVVVDPVEQPQEVAAQPEVEVLRSENEETDTAVSEAIGEFGVTPDDTGLQECAVCGFTFSSNFLRLIDGRKICPVCAN